MNATVAVSDARGTTLPRDGFFPGVRAPHYRGTVINGELHDAISSTETTISSWLERHEYEVTQTTVISPRSANFLLESWTQADSRVVRNTDVAYVFVSGWHDPTDSPWQDLRRTLAPLKAASDALLADISDTLAYDRKTSASVKHAGLTAVARLTDMLGLTRPAILRMGGVPGSTFYAWQKNPHSTIRTPTVARLLRLQAQVAILDEALGRDRMRAWIFSGGRLDKLQGDEAAFAQVLAEAQTALTEATRITPRPRMRPADYASVAGATEGIPTPDSPSWPGAAKTLDGDTSQE